MECSTDFSDYEDISAYHPSRYDLYPSIPTQDISSESDSNLTPEGLKRAVQHSRRMIQGRPGTRKCLSDTETLDTLSQLPGERAISCSFFSLQQYNGQRQIDT
eukprot:XP_011678128.1 PREDICTED: uncharacterized protein LOC100893364 isoform X2 [Strongylocentrotus purpuratus]